MDRPTLEYYRNNADDVFLRYEGVPPDTLLPHVFSQSSTVLDIGCGAGRDMSFLHRNGYLVYGIEPVQELRQLAVSRQPELENRIFPGSLPDDIPQLPVEKFDGVLLYAVLMHIDEGRLFDAAMSVRSLLKEGGTLLVSIPTERDDLVSVGHDGDTSDTSRNSTKEGPAGMGETPHSRDEKGRLMIIRPEARVRLLFERLGFDTESRYYSADRLGREGVRWVSLVFRYCGGGISESVDKIESIINQDRKWATYKLALLRGLCDIAQTESHSARWDSSGNVHVPLSSIARKWIEYYWPIVESSKFIPQMRGEKSGGSRFIGFRRNLEDLIDLYRQAGGMEEFLYQRDEGRMITQARPIFTRTLGDVKTAIRQPIYYAGGGSSEYKPFSYSPRDKSVVLKADLWRELLLLGHIIGDTIILRWAELTADISKQEVSISKMVELLLKEVYPERNVTDVRGVYRGIEQLECVWTGESLAGFFDVDHAIPFSIRHDNSLWNLFPSDPGINNEKRDKLPDSILVKKRGDAIHYYWDVLKSELSGRFESDYTRITGQERLPEKTWQGDLFSVFLEVIESTAVTRNTPRWHV